MSNGGARGRDGLAFDLAPDHGRPASSATVAGAGTGMRPCALWMNPRPNGMGEQTDSVDAEQVDSADCTHDIDQRVQSAQLVQVDVLRVRCGVNACLDLADAPKDRNRLLDDLPR